MKEGTLRKKILLQLLKTMFFLLLMFNITTEKVVVAEESTSVEFFTYKELNGTYCAVTGYTGTETDIVVPSELGGYIVQQISSGAFSNNTTLEKVVLPEGIERIGANAFSGCTGLTKVKLPETLTYIDYYAFYNCTSLVEITIPNGVKTIVGRAFTNCTGLTEVNLPVSWESINGSPYGSETPFVGCTKLTEITLPEEMTTVPAYAFYGCKSLKTVNFAESVTTIDGSAFYSCTSLEALELPDGLEQINSSAFYGCTSLEALELPDGLSQINSSAFYGCTSLTEVKLPDALTELNSGVFCSCTGLKEVVLPEKLTTIGSQAFYGCSSIEEISLPESLTTIKSSAFYNCKGLKSITIPEGVTKLESSTFSGCTGLTEVTLPKTLTCIDYYAFESCTGLTEITIPDGVKTIVGRAFTNCTGLTEVNLPVSWESINGSPYGSETPFVGCTKLTEITLPEGMTTVPAYAFYGCKSLKTVNFAESVTTIGGSAFYGCTGLQGLELPDGLLTISGGAFQNCTGLQGLELPDGLLTVNGSAFAYCTGLQSVDIPDSVTTILGDAFYGCTNLSKVEMSTAWTENTSSYSPFRSCTKLTEIILPEGMTKLADYAFSDCDSLELVILPDTLTEIGTRAFSECAVMERVWIPDSVTKVGSNAFYNTSGVTIHGVEGSYAQEYAATNNIPFSTEEITFETSTVSGRVVDEAGAGVADVTVAFYDVTQRKLLNTSAVTDSEGKWSCEDVVTGNTYNISFTNPYYRIDSIKNIVIAAEENDAGDAVAEKVMDCDVAPAEDFTYSALNGAYCAITKYTGTATEVIIPDEIDGYTVQKISSGAFSGNTTLEKVVLPEEVVRIDYNAFSGCKALTYVGFSTKLEYIDYYAFESCTGLTEITIPDGVKTIVGRAFSNCTGLTEVNLPVSWESINGSPYGSETPFRGCTKLTEITLPEGMTTVPAYAFYGCKSLKTVNFAESVTTIGGSAFYNCTSLEALELPDGLSQINSSAFYGCTSLTEVKLPDALIELNSGVFSGCTGLKEVVFPEGLTTIGSQAFYGCSSIEEISLPESLTTIKSSAFYNCKGLKSITIPEGVTKLESSTFSGCTGLTEVTLPKTLTCIDYYAFESCTSLVEITIPDSVKTISGRAFSNCTGLTEVNLPVFWESINGSPYGSETPFVGCTKLTEITLPEGMTTVPAYAFYGCKSLKTVNFAESVTTIDGSAFYSCTSLEALELPDGLEQINSSAFYGCTNLEALELPDGLSQINSSAFYGCTSLTEVKLPDALTELNSGVFCGCTGLKEIVFPEGLTTIGSQAFYGCSSIEEISLPESLTTIKYGAFRNCNGLTGITVPEGVEKLENSTFYGCTSLSEVKLPESLTYIDYYAFESCTSLVEITIPDSVKTISGRAFSNCTGLTEVNLPVSWESINGSPYGSATPFTGCTKLTEITLPEGMTTVPAYAFYGCTSLKTVKFAESVTTIGGSAFYNCTGLQSVDIPDSVTTILADAFYGCTNLSKVELSTAWTINNSHASPFRSCTKLTEMILPEGMTKLADYAFYGCGSLELVILPDTLTEIGHRAFSHCAVLECVWIPDSVTKIGSYVFEITSGVTIHGVEGSYAQEYALANNIPFSTEELTFETTAVSGRVVDEAGAGVTGVKVAFYDVTQRKLLNTSAVTDSEGKWSCEDVVTGNTYNISFTNPYYKIDSIKNLVIATEGNETGDVVAEKVMDCDESSATDFTYSALNGAYCTITKYKGTATEVIIPDEIDGYTVQKISSGAFSGNTTLEKVVLPEEVVRIDSSAFSGCKALTYVGFSTKLEYIDYYAFESCTGLTEITIPDGVKTIVGRAFSNCTGLTEVNLPVSWESINGSPYGSETPFVGCTKLTEITLPEGMTTVPAYAFYGCKSLKTVNFAESVTTIGGSAFYNCTSLEALELPDGLEQINSSAFYSCTSLTQVKLPDALTVLNGSVLSGCTGLKEIVFPEGLTTIGSQAFYGCSSIEEISLPESLTTIKSSAFYNCKGLKSITIPEGVTKLESSTFSGCTGLTEVTLPKTLTCIDYYAFESCTGLTEITIPDSVKTISGRAFSNCTGLTEVNLPVSWESINGSPYGSETPFVGCTKLTEITLPEGMTTVPAYAFYGCTSLKTVKFAESVTKIGSQAFYDCTGLRMLDFNESLEVIGSSAFAGCDGLVSLVINDNLTTLSNYAFSNCENLTAARVPKTVTSFGADCFSGCNKLTVYCYSGSAAHMALENTSYKYFLLDEHDHEYEIAVETSATCIMGGSQIKTCTICGYNYIELTDPLGHDYLSTVKEATCTEDGYTTYTCSRCNDTYIGDYVKALGHSYGEWIVEKEATVLVEGSRHRSCSGCDKEETETTERIYVDVETSSEYGLVEFTVVNAQSLDPIKGAQIFVTTETEGEETFSTEADGTVSIILPVGKQQISVYASGCLTRNLKITVEPGVNEIQQIGLSDIPTYNAELTSDRMTIEEIIDAGIDVSAPGNKNVFKYELKLEFEPEIDWLSIIAYFNEDGEYIGGYSPNNEDSGGGNGGNGGENSYILHYHVGSRYSGHWECKNEEVAKGQNVALTYKPERDSEDYVFDGWYADADYETKISSVTIEQNSTIVYGRWIYTGEGDGGESSIARGIRIPVKNNTEVITVYPVSEYFYLIIRGEVSWLKEMFDVQMLIMNNSMTDTLEDVVATLELPEGLSLATMKGTQQTLKQEVGHVAEGDSELVHWYVRGDSTGSYGLSAKLTGTVMPFEEPIDQTFVSKDHIQVWGGDALRLHFEFPSAAYKDEEYPVRVTLTNVSDITLYNVCQKVQLEQGMEIYYSDGSVDDKIDYTDWKYGRDGKLEPGESIVVEISMKIFFESEMMKRKLEELIGVVDGVEKLVNTLDALETVVNVTGSLVDMAGGCIKAINKMDFSGVDKLKVDMVKKLLGVITDLKSACETGGNDPIDAATGFVDTGLQVAFDAITSDPDEWLKENGIDAIEQLADKTLALKESITNNANGTKDFDIYDSLRTAISAIPIKFALKNVFMTEDEDNNTRIPWTYSVLPSSARYFGVSNVSKYLKSLAIAAMGEAYDKMMPSPLQLVPGLDDPLGKEEAIKYIQATEQEIKEFQAKDSTGEITFTVRAERSGVYSARTYNAIPSSSEEPFLITCDNDTAVYEDGVLTFTGDGTISVIPQDQTGGTLIIEDSEGNTYTYVIDVVEQHDCTAGEQQVVVAPTSENDGFAVLCCETCGEIMDIVMLHYDDCCTDHEFGAWETEVAETAEVCGMYVRNCIVCGVAEYQFTEKLAPDEEIPEIDTTIYKGVDYSAVYNYEYYSSNYPEIAGNLLKYFVTTGMSLGHQASEEFNLEIYKSNYPWLVSLYGDENEEYYMHYITIGKDEGRNASSIIEEMETDDVIDFINRMYELILERTPDEESQIWVELLLNGSYTATQVANGFIMSDEFLNKEMSNEEFVRIMYRVFFNREADEEGLTAWTEYLDNGYMKKFVFAGFTNSVEFQTLCDKYKITRGYIKLTLAEQEPNLTGQDFDTWQFVERLYSEVLGRTPDRGGLEAWVDLLKSGEYSGAQVAGGFIMSNEFINKKMSDEKFLKIMYRAFFNRDADEEGLEAWLDVLASGHTKQYVFAGFANSDEFERVCNEYGIIRGSIPME